MGLDRVRLLPTLVVKDLRRRLRSPLGYLAALCFPLLFAGLIGLSFGGGGEAGPRLYLLVENQDEEGLLAEFLISALTSEQAGENLEAEVVGDDGLERLEHQGAAALLRIPAGFTDDVLDGRPVVFELVRNPAQGILPEVAEQLAGVLAEGLDAASRALRGPLDQLAAMIEAGAEPTDEDLIAMTLAVRGVIDGAEEVVFPPVITLESTTLEGKGDAGGGPPGVAVVFLMVLPGVSVYALFLIGDLAMRDLLVETRLGTLTRQLAGPVRPGTLLAGKVVYAAVLTAASLLLLAVLGLVWLERPVDPAGFLALSLAVVLAVTGAGAVVYGAAGNERRGATISSIVYLVLAFAGGAFGGMGSVPPVVRRVAPLSPFYWGTTGFDTLLGAGGGLADVLVHVSVLGGLGVVLLAIGAVLLGRRMGRGVAA